jgi:4-hydroxy-tetrahydrodipicolinate reductase
MKIAIIGYGKMGHMIEEVALSRGHEIVCRIDANPTLTLPSREGMKVWSPEEGFQSEAFRSADVAIEFTTPATAEENIRKSWEQGVPVVCGSTGINKPNPDPSLKGREEGNKWIVRNEKGKVMLVWSSNYSVGVNIFFEVNKLLAEEMASQPQYTPSITETHHIHKLDKPSGTAKTLAEQIENELPSLQGGAGGRLPIESIREGEVPGTHEVKWDSEEDTIIITHVAKGRRGFALGAVLAAEGLLHK